MTNDNSKPAQPKRESYIRWQGRAIEQFGFSLNLILTFSLASVAFEFSFLAGKDLQLSNPQLYLHIASLLLLLVSLAFGLLCVVNRLEDFRLTKEIAWKRESGVSRENLQPIRDKARAIGNRTWWLFWWQIGLFTLGVSLMVVALGIFTLKKHFL